MQGPCESIQFASYSAMLNLLGAQIFEINFLHSTPLAFKVRLGEFFNAWGQDKRIKS